MIQSRAVHSYSPHTGRTLSSAIDMGVPDVINKYIDMKCKQYERSKSRAFRESDHVLFSFGVLPPVAERGGKYEPAGVVLFKDGKRTVIQVPKFKGPLKTLVEPRVFSQYL
jgi:hypothetical protein